MNQTDTLILEGGALRATFLAIFFILRVFLPLVPAATPAATAMVAAVRPAAAIMVFFSILHSPFLGKSCKRLGLRYAV